MRIDWTGDDVAAAVKEDVRVRLGAGALVVFPTETFYGIGCRPDSCKAVDRLLAAKGRPPGRPLPLVAATAGDARRVVDLPADLEDLWERLTGAFWPGALTLVAPARTGLAPGVLADGASIGVRVSSHPVARQLAGLCGGVLVATSANLSGNPPSRDLAGIDAALLGAADITVDGGICPGGEPSTVFRLRQRGGEIIRRGVVPARDILAVAGAAGRS